MRIRSPRGLCLSLGTVVVALLMGAAPASAGLTPYWLGPETGNFGVHDLTDNGQYPGATCTYNGVELSKISIRRPVVYAFNRTSHTDTQTVGYRYILEYNDGKFSTTAYSDWPDAHLGKVIKATATDAANARWSAASYTFPNGVAAGHQVWRISIRMFWYYPTATKIDGKALQVVENYQTGASTETQFFCYSALA